MDWGKEASRAEVGEITRKQLSSGEAKGAMEHGDMCPNHCPWKEHTEEGRLATSSVFAATQRES